MYVGGGYERKSTNDKWDSYKLGIYNLTNLTTNQWSSSPIMTPQCMFAMTVLDDKLIIAGGWTNSGKITNKVFVLTRGQWNDYNEIPASRANATAVVCNSKMIVVGGVDGFTTLATTELLDTTNGC